MVEIEPLEPTLWFAAISKLDQRSRRAVSRELESLLRHGYHLLQLTPHELRNVLRPALSEAAFEQLLETGDFEAAAKGLLGADASFTVFQTGTGLFEAQVRVTQGSEAHLAQAAEPASALLRAWINSVSEIDGRITAPRNENPRPAPRKGRSVRHLRLIEH
jgi:hypothetical protein